MKSVSIAVAALAALALAGPVRAQKAVPAVELTDPAGDIYGGNGPENARDVVKLSLGSDGTHVLVGATLAQDERSTVAGSAVLLYFDTDNRAGTGGKTDFGQGGFEYQGELAVCLSYDGAQIAACAGGAAESLPKSRHARGVIEKFTGKPGQEMRSFENLERVRDGFGRAEAPLQGRRLEVKIAYGDLGIKPGQVVRILARETDQFSAEGFFPEAHLLLK